MRTAAPKRRPFRSPPSRIRGTPGRSGRRDCHFHLVRPSSGGFVDTRARVEVLTSSANPGRVRHRDHRRPQCRLAPSGGRTFRGGRRPDRRPTGATDPHRRVPRSSWNRPGVQAEIGRTWPTYSEPRSRNSGYSLIASGLPAGHSQIAVFAHDTVLGGFAPAALREDSSLSAASLSGSRTSRRCVYPRIARP